MAPCLSVCLSVTSRCSTKTAKRWITQTTPHDSPGLEFSEAKDLSEIRLGSPPTGAPNAGGLGQNRRDFRQITGYISKTVQDRRMVSIKVECALCALSNGDIADDLECPLTAPNHPIFCIFTAIHSFTTGETRDFKFFKFGTLTYHSKSQPADEKSSLKGA